MNALVPTKNPKIGNYYHVSWANSGCVWKLKSFHQDGIHCWLQTPKSRKLIKVKILDLRLLRETAAYYQPN